MNFLGERIDELDRKLAGRLNKWPEIKNDSMKEKQNKNNKNIPIATYRNR